MTRNFLNIHLFLCIELLCVWLLNFQVWVRDVILLAECLPNLDKVLGSVLVMYSCNPKTLEELLEVFQNSTTLFKTHRGREGETEKERETEREER